MEQKEEFLPTRNFRVGFLKEVMTELNLGEWLGITQVKRRVKGVPGRCIILSKDTQAFNSMGVHGKLQTFLYH